MSHFAASLLLALLASQDPEPTVERVRASVERSLPFLEKEGLAWVKQRDCLSCHQVTFMLWSHQEARSRGIAIDAKKFADWSDWSRNESLSQHVRLKLAEPALESLPADLHAKLSPLTKKNGLKEAAFVKELEKTLTPEELAPHKDALLKNAAREKGDGGGLDTMSQLLLAGVTGADDDRTSAFLAATRARLRELQQPDGSWKAGGQLPRMNRSEAEGTELTTMWTVLALSEGPEVTRALAFLKDAKPGKTNEGLALRLMLAKKFGEGDAFAALAKELIGRQNPDGSWAWLQGGTGDAFATGQVLYALGVTGAADPAAVQRARAYLLGTQTADGSWTVPPPALTSPSTAPDRLKRLEPIYRYWGSAWAAIGLARTLPAKS